MKIIIALLMMIHKLMVDLNVVKMENGQMYVKSLIVIMPSFMIKQMINVK